MGAHQRELAPSRAPTGKPSASPVRAGSDTFACTLSRRTDGSGSGEMRLGPSAGDSPKASRGSPEKITTGQLTSDGKLQNRLSQPRRAIPWIIQRSRQRGTTIGIFMSAYRCPCKARGEPATLPPLMDGKDKQIERLRCTECGQEFSERRVP